MSLVSPFWNTVYMYTVFQNSDDIVIFWITQPILMIFGTWNADDILQELYIVK